jgi:hypothetical protein
MNMKKQAHLKNKILENLDPMSNHQDSHQELDMYIVSEMLSHVQNGLGVFFLGIKLVRSNNHIVMPKILKFTKSPDFSEGNSTNEKYN